MAFQHDVVGGGMTRGCEGGGSENFRKTFKPERSAKTIFGQRGWERNFYSIFVALFLCCCLRWVDTAFDPICGTPAVIMLLEICKWKSFLMLLASSILVENSRFVALLLFKMIFEHHERMELSAKFKLEVKLNKRDRRRLHWKVWLWLCRPGWRTWKGGRRWIVSGRRQICRPVRFL